MSDDIQCGARLSLGVEDEAVCTLEPGHEGDHFRGDLDDEQWAAANPGRAPMAGDRSVSRKLVSVVTGTYNRHELLLGAIENIRQQTYRPLEHVIVSDGPDNELADLMKQLQEVDVTRRYPEIIFQELGFWSSGLFTNSISAVPFMVAQLMARGEYQVWWADDERALVPDHISRLVDLLEQYDVDFAYPRVEMTWPDSDRRLVIGSNPPRCGHFTHCLYRRDMLNRGALFRTYVGNETDWDACARMMASGAKWAFLDDVTFTHRVDK